MPLPSGIAVRLLGELVAQRQRGRGCEEDDGVVVANRRDEQPVGVRRGGRNNGLDAGVDEQRVRVVGVLGGQPESGSRARDEVDDRHGRLAAGHQPQLLRLVDDLLERDVEQRRDLELDDRAVPASAAPVAKPVNICSEIGMSSTRSSKSAARPFVTPRSDSRTSSPSTNTFGSRSISSRNAFASAWR